MKDPFYHEFLRALELLTSQSSWEHSSYFVCVFLDTILQTCSQRMFNLSQRSCETIYLRGELKTTPWKWDEQVVRSKPSTLALCGMSCPQSWHMGEEMGQDSVSSPHGAERLPRPHLCQDCCSSLLPGFPTSPLFLSLPCLSPVPLCCPLTSKSKPNIGMQRSFTTIWLTINGGVNCILQNCSRPIADTGECDLIWK